MGSQNGLFDQYLGNEKRYDLETMLYSLNVDIFAFFEVIIVIFISFGSRHFPILEFGAQKRGFPDLDFGGLFWGFYDP